MTCHPVALDAAFAAGQPEWFLDAMARQPERHVTQVLGTDIEWLAWGDVERPGLLLLHGFLASASWWRAVAGPLSATFRIIAPSWSGMGGSGWRDRYTPEIFVREGMAVATAAGLFAHSTRPVIGAHSLGATIGASMAASDDRFGGFISIDRAIRLQSSVAPLSVPKKRRHFADVEQARRQYRLYPAPASVPRFVLDQVAADALCPADGGGWHLSHDPHIVADIKGTPSIEDQVAAIRCPIAFIRGALSPTFNEAAEAFNRDFAPSGTRHVTIEHSGHHIPLEQPQQLARVIAELAQEMTA